MRKEITAHYVPLRDPITLVTVARLDHSKGHDLLLRAFEIVLVNHPKTILKIVGDGIYKQKLELLAKDLKLDKNTEFLGNIPPNQVIDEYMASFLCVYPARIDNCPLSVIEAMSCGKPIVGFKTGGIPELVLDGFNGLLVTPEDYIGLANAICKIIEDPLLYKSLAENSKIIFREKFELNKGVRLIVDWIQGLETKERVTKYE